MNETFLSFPDLEIHCWVIAKETFTDERKNFFGIPFTLVLFVACKPTPLFFADVLFCFQML